MIATIATTSNTIRSNSTIVIRTTLPFETVTYFVLALAGVYVLLARRVERDRSREEWQLRDQLTQHRQALREVCDVLRSSTRPHSSP